VWRERVVRQFEFFRTGLSKTQAPYGQVLLAFESWLAPPEEIVLFAQNEEILVEQMTKLAQSFRPGALTLPIVVGSEDERRLRQSSLAYLVRDREFPTGKRSGLYRCRGGQCNAPEYS
jgi:hypothetical protein